MPKKKPSPTELAMAEPLSEESQALLDQIPRTCKVPASLHSPHLLIERWLAQDARERKAHSNLYGRTFEGYFTSSLAKRRLCILDTIIKCIEPLGFTVTAEGPYNRHPIEFRKGLETLFITLDEPNKQMRRLLTKEERLKKPYLRDDQKWTQTVEPSGDLRIKIKSYERGSVLFEFRDEPGAPLENNIRAVFESFMKGLDKVRKERAKREQQSKRWAEARQREQEAEAAILAEQEKKQELVESSKLWHTAKTLRDYIEAVQVATKKHADPKDLKLWIRWAQVYADQLDPLINGVALLDIKKVTSAS